MAVTDPSAIPANKRDTIKAICVTHGPRLLPDRYPTDAEGQPKTTLTNAEAAQVFEHITRKFWRDLIVQHEADAAAESARRAAIEGNATDPFGS